jgi:hypothetical protein
MRGEERVSTTLSARLERAAVAIVGDLSLFISLCAARLMVWRTLRHRDREWAREHAERRKKFKPAPGDRGADEYKLTPGVIGVRDEECEALAFARSRGADAVALRRMTRRQ